MYPNLIKCLTFLFLFILNTSVLRSQFQNQNLVAHFLMDGNAKDVSGYNNHGVLFGPNPAADRFGQENHSYYFNGQNNYILVPNASSLNPTEEITVSAWYKTTPFVGSGTDPIVNKAYTSHTEPYYQYHLGVCGNQYWNAQSRFTFYLAINDKLDGLNTEENLYSLDTWYHIAGTYDGTTIKLYVNGVLRASKVQPGKMKDYGSDIFIGRHKNSVGGSTYYLPGNIDDVRIYSRALSQNELLDLYKESAPEAPVEFNFTSQGSCVNAPVNFSYSGFSGYDSLQWNFGDNSFSKELNPSHLYKNSGNFDVTVSIFYKNQKSELKKTVSVSGVPLVKLGNDTVVCPGNIINLIAGNSDATYTWNTGLINSNIFINKSGTYHVTATNSCGTSGDTIKVLFSEFEPVWVTADTLLCRNTMARISAKGPSGYQFIWNNSFEGKVFELLPETNQTLDLVIVNEHNCQKEFKTFINVKDCFKEIIIPNVFTPNGDGTNDFWVIENLDKYPNAVIEVFNRWGEVVFKSIGYLNPWDGYYNGKRLSPGCYYYNIILNAGFEAYKGPVMIYQ